MKTNEIYDRLVSGKREDVCDDLFTHMREEFGAWDWLEISDHGRELYNQMSGSEVEAWSPLDGVFSAISAQSHYGTIKAVCAMLGIKDVQAFRLLLARWYEKQSNPPPPIDPATLHDAVAEEGADFEAQCNMRATKPRNPVGPQDNATTE